MNTIVITFTKDLNHISLTLFNHQMFIISNLFKQDCQWLKKREIIILLPSFYQWYGSKEYPKTLLKIMIKNREENTVG